MAIFLEVNPDLDAQAFTQAYERDGFVQVPNLMTAASADYIAGILEQHVRWRLTISQDSTGETSTPLDQENIPAANRPFIEARLKGALEGAREGLGGYVYLSYPMITAYVEKWEPTHPIHIMVELINSPDFLALVRTITGRPDIIKADALATLYRPGDFLTQHDDSRGLGRVAAYTLGFTRTWRPDWGGQLLFHDDDGGIRRGFAPAFNTLTLFKVPQSHSVAPVAPYAGAPRVSIVGWARNDGPSAEAV